MNTRALSLALTGYVAVWSAWSACTPSEEVAQHATPDAAAEPPGGHDPRDPDVPALVVVVVMDQLASWVLERYAEHLPEDGALRTAMAEGAYHARAVFSYAATVTAPGHAAIFTGAAPYRSGIISNVAWDHEQQAVVPAVWDPQHPGLEHTAAGVSPFRLRVPTVADALKAATDGQARVVSLSTKDRGAVLAAGQQPDAVLWYEPTLPGYTTSTYYADAIPDWLEQWQRRHPFEGLLVPWEPLDADSYRDLLGPDDAIAEGGLGFGPAFPHDPNATPLPYFALLATPQSTEHLLELAAEAAVRYELGSDEVPDLLAISISGSDYVGHFFGPDSWEYLDNLIRIDRALAKLVATLQDRGPTAVLVTSDHGVTSLPERRLQAGLQAGRVDDFALHEQLEAAATRELGPGSHVAAVSAPFVYLSDKAEERMDRDALIELLREELQAHPGIQAAYDVRDAAELRQSADAVERAVGRSIPDDVEADVYLLLAEGWVPWPEGVPGTGHGTPWPDDAEVPVLFWGAGVRQLTSSEPVSQEGVAPTIAALLGVPPPAAADEPPLAGVGAR